jgi:hypothetical protein
MRNGFAMQKMENACDVLDTACTVYERFVRHWQPLKGISIKNIYVRELSLYKLYKFKGAI